MPAPVHPLRHRLLMRVRRGEIANIREIMVVASVTRRTAERWLRESGIKLVEARLHQVAKMHEQEENYLASKSGMKRPTVNQRRRELLKSVRRFNEANTKEPRPARAASGTAPEME